MSRKTAVAALVFAAFASVASAQTFVSRADYPTVNFDRLNSGDPVPGEPGHVFVHNGQGWIVVATTPTPVPAPQPGAPDCDPIPNPYAEPARAAACSAWDAEHRAKPALPSFEADTVYTDTYNDFRVYVLSVGRSLEGVPVVTAQRLKPADGFVFSFRVDTPEAQRWFRVQ